MITQERVRELFDYRDDGVLVWRVHRPGAKIGGIAGCISINKYRYIGVERKLYYAHRLIWLWHNGYLPENNIDHINRIAGDDRIENLREVTQSCNVRNTGNNKTNTSGIKGVSFYGRDGTWEARIKVNDKYFYLGRYSTILEAACHRLAAEQSLDWAGCDDNSPAFQYVQSYLQGTYAIL